VRTVEDPTVLTSLLDPQADADRPLHEVAAI
jgi:hypothetical protein